MSSPGPWELVWKNVEKGPPILSRTAAYPLLLITVLTLGVNWPLLSIGLRDIPPIWMAAMRLAGGAVIVLTATAFTGRLRPPPCSDLPVLASVAFLRLALVLILVFTALRMVPPGRSSVLAWTASLWTVPLAAIFLGERMTRLRTTGLILGLTGIAFLFEPWSFAWSDPRVLGGHLMLLVAAVSNAGASVHIRRHSWTSSPLELLPWQLLAAALPLTVLAFVIEGVPHIDWTTLLVLIVLYQGPGGYCLCGMGANDGAAQHAGHLHQLDADDDPGGRAGRV
ncbi:MAG TPA: DMT family transporter, partial [Acidimicrobiia bacterium]|nr:DMT family transporter [Acidimicrobiia bacterium]